VTYKHISVVLKFWTVQQASPGWAIRFCKRHPELLQRCPALDTALPSPLLQKVEKFRYEVQQIVRESSLSLDCVGNMDELYLSFSALMSGRSILEAVKLVADCLHTFIHIITYHFYLHQSFPFLFSCSVGYPFPDSGDCNFRFCHVNSHCFMLRQITWVLEPIFERDATLIYQKVTYLSKRCR
jgi:hypothetical protein